MTLLQRALAHYGVESLDRTPALEEACYRLFVSQERADLARAAVMAILERRLERADELVGTVGDEFRGVLDRLELATERRDPVIADHARQLRNRYYDQPRDRRSARPRPTRSSSAHLDALLEDPDRADRDEHIDAVVEAPQLLAPQLIEPHERRPARASTRCCWRS